MPYAVDPEGSIEGYGYGEPVETGGVPGAGELRKPVWPV